MSQIQDCTLAVPAATSKEVKQHLVAISFLFSLPRVGWVGGGGDREEESERVKTNLSHLAP